MGGRHQNFEDPSTCGRDFLNTLYMVVIMTHSHSHHAVTIYKKHFLNLKKANQKLLSYWGWALECFKTYLKSNTALYFAAFGSISSDIMLYGQIYVTQEFWRWCSEPDIWLCLDFKLREMSDFKQLNQYGNKLLKLRLLLCCFL